MRRRIAIVLAGGDGTRLWPVSTGASPKQLNPRLFRVPLITQAYERAASIVSPENTYVLTTERIADGIRTATNIPEDHLLMEPMRRDTGPALAFAAGYFSHEPDTVCAVLYADHTIDDSSAFRDALERAYELAHDSETLVTIGTVPSSPLSELGYVLRGNATPDGNGFAVTAFIEKPSEDIARELLTQGALWNTGMYVWTPSALLSIMDVASPALASGVREAGRAYRDGRQDDVRAWYERITPESFDRAVSERTTRFSVVESTHRWRDVGTWQTFYEVLPKDEGGNVCVLPEDGLLALSEAHGNVVMPSQRRVILIGVEDLVIASNDDCLLVAKRDQSHRVKELLKQIT